MEIILLERVEKLGNIGDVVNVRTGFARNFLLPKGKALRASDENKKRFEASRAQIEAENAKRREAAIKDSAALEGRTVVLIRQASNTGQLYGSVAARDVAEALSETGVSVNRNQVRMDRPIKTLGVHEIAIVPHPEVSRTIRVNIARSPEEADLQAQGVDVTAEMFEREPQRLHEELEDEAAAAEAETAAEAAQDETSA